jgi:hypothetical protein
MKPVTFGFLMILEAAVVAVVAVIAIVTIFFFSTRKYQVALSH